MKYTPWLLLIISSLFLSYTDYQGSQLPGRPLSPYEYQLPGRPYDDSANQMPGKPVDPTEWGLPGRAQLPGQNTSFTPEYDSQLRLKIMDALSAGGSYTYRFSNIYPVVREGYVTLRGTVASEYDKMDALARVQRIYGIKGINNQIIVQPW